MDETTNFKKAERLTATEETLREAKVLLARFEYLPFGAMVARRVVDGAWITDDESAVACEQTSFTCPICTWPQAGHHGPGRYKGNAANTHEEGCSLWAVLDGLPTPRLASSA